MGGGWQRQGAGGKRGWRFPSEAGERGGSPGRRGEGVGPLHDTPPPHARLGWCHPARAAAGKTTVSRTTVRGGGGGGGRRRARRPRDGRRGAPPVLPHARAVGVGGGGGRSRHCNPLSGGAYWFFGESPQSSTIFSYLLFLYLLVRSRWVRVHPARTPKHPMRATGGTGQGGQIRLDPDPPPLPSLVAWRPTAGWRRQLSRLPPTAAPLRHAWQPSRPFGSASPPLRRAVLDVWTFCPPS